MWKGHLNKIDFYNGDIPLGVYQNEIILKESYKPAIEELTNWYLQNLGLIKDTPRIVSEINCPTLII